jgi:hypothetical protein
VDEEIVIALPISEWQVVVRHLARGTYEEVFHIIHKLSAQGDPQIQAARLRAAEREIEDARQASRTSSPSSASNQTEPRAESDATQIH